MKELEIERVFLEFFEKNGHKIYESASLLPKDKSILFTIAGMVPFKDFFLGKAIPKDKRVTTSQRCIRTNDIDQIGKTARHLSTFDMLGNFSFGDYYKEEAIGFAYNLLKVLGMNLNKIIVTVYKDDKDAYDIWLKYMPASKLYKLDEKTNFWNMGPVGPCGPSSELYYILKDEEFDPDSDSFIEIYNMVFMQYNRENGLHELPNKNIDTGMGLQRVAMVLQGKESVFDIDTFSHIRESLIKESSVRAREAENIILDHLKAATLLIYDDVRPSNEKQGYVLRRLIRRAAKYGRELKLENFLAKLSKSVVEVYPYLKDKEDIIYNVIAKEEEKFSQVLTQGLELLEARIKASNLDKEFVFKLFDTYGFPFDLTKEIAKSKGVEVSEDDFNKMLEAHQELSRTNISFEKNIKEEDYGNKYGKTKFVDELFINAKLLFYKENNGIFEVIFDRTPFYAESGGQVADVGIIESEAFKGEVIDVQKVSSIFVHYVKPLYGTLQLANFNLKVDEINRRKTAANHSATHLLHSAAKQVLGDARQAGSLVTPERLRLDLTIDRAISKDELIKIEKLVNEEIIKNRVVKVEHKTLEEAKNQGAIAYFEDRYGDVVRVISMGEFSSELCGGTHVRSTAEIGLFKILSEKGIAANVRRIEAITGLGILAKLDETEKIVEDAKKIVSAKASLNDKLLSLVKELNISKAELNKIKADFLKDKIENCKIKIKDVDFILLKLDESFMNDLKQLNLNKYLFIASSQESIVAMHNNLALDLGNIFKSLLLKGGGRHNFAKATLPEKEHHIIIERLKSLI